jgi:hypothetical protein
MREELSEEAQRMPRWNITPETLTMLEGVFRTQPFPPIVMREKLAKTLDVTARQVQIWFQNRRQRARHTKLKGHTGPFVDAYPSTVAQIGVPQPHAPQQLGVQWCAPRSRAGAERARAMAASPPSFGDRGLALAPGRAHRALRARHRARALTRHPALRPRVPRPPLPSRPPHAPIPGPLG